MARCWAARSSRWCCKFPALSRGRGRPYNEPADWFYPTRHFLGAALLDAGKAKQAEEVYRADLQRQPDNGWALFGLTAALAAQPKYLEAETRRLLQRAFREADVVLTSSAF